MNLELFKQFGKTKTIDERKNFDVIGYTRVSSKEQLTNNSLGYQEEAIEKFVKDAGFNLLNIIGGTYESASGDFTRKEFTKLIDTIKRMRRKPYAILVFKMSRFSRTGGGAIGLANKLIEELGVHIYEVSTGRNTTTEQGKVEIYTLLLEARRENITKLSQTLPGMIKHLEKGNWIGKVPKGYDHYGPKVTNHTRHREKQEIKINKEGRTLQKAWKWKLQGEKDCDILKKLNRLGVELKKQYLSEMWRNTFYCGIISTRLLDGKVVKGNWEKIVSEEEFLYVQEILKGTNHGYTHNNHHSSRPLTGFIYCKECGSKMAGYEVKYKKVHYYKCQRCPRVSINSITTKKAKGIGANDMFIELLGKYGLDSSLSGPFKAQLALTYASLNKEKDEDVKLLQGQLQKLENELKMLKRRFMLESGMDKCIYRELVEEFEAKIESIKDELSEQPSSISNLKNYIDISVKIVRNISQYYVSGDLEIKRKIQELVFPEGLFIDTKNRVYLTKKVNEIFEATASFSTTYDKENKNDIGENPMSSWSVPRSRLELPTFGL